MTPRTLLSVLCFAFLASVPLFAQVYPFRSYKVSDGLAHSGVLSLFQDSRGYYWIGTVAGLSFYDGVGFRNCLQQGEERSQVEALLQAADSALWVATEGNGIAQLSLQGDVTGWMRAKDGLLTSDSVYALIRDSEKNTWIGTTNGILVIHPDGTSNHLTTAHGLLDDEIRAISQRGDGTMWIASISGALGFRYSPEGLTDRRVVVRQTALALCPTADGGMLIGTSEGRTQTRGLVLKVRCDDQVDTLMNTKRAGGPLKVLSLFEDRRGAVWIGAPPGLFMVDGGNISYIGEKSGLQAGDVNCLMEDAAGNLWLGGAGLTRLPARSFRFYPLKDTFAGVVLRFGLSARDGSVWLGGFGRLIRKKPGRMFVEIPPPAGAPAWNVQGIAEDATGTIWITSSAGLMQFRNERLSRAEIEGFSQRGTIDKIHVDRSGDLWIGSQAILCHIRGNRVLHRYGPSHGIPQDNLLSVTSAPDGSIWFGTNASGAGRLFTGHVAMFGTADGLPSDAVNEVFVDKDSVLWFSTRRGLATYADGLIRPMDTLNALLGGEPVARQVIQDSGGRYWISTRSGLYMWDGARLSHYDSRDGLPSDLMHCSFFDQEGNLWAGTSGGAAVLNGRSIDIDVAIPVVHVLLMNEDGTGPSVPLQSSYAYDENSVSLGFHATGFVDEQGVEYEWRMAGRNEHWHSERGPKTIRFPILPPGEYRFHIRARNRNGEWSPTTEHAFEIRSPFWQRWWFYAGISVLAVLLLWAIYQYRIRHLLEIEHLRLRIAGDLHDEIGSYLGGIALESQMMQRKIPLSADARDRLSRITAMALRTADAMRDMVWLINPEHDTLGTLLVKMKDVSQQLAGAARLSFRGPTGHTEEPLDLEFKRHVFLIYKEAICNASRHAHATGIDVFIDRTDGHLSFSVKDNGKGFDSTAARYGNGIRNMKDRAAKIGATLRIEGEPGAGTTVTLVAPL